MKKSLLVLCFGLISFFPACQKCSRDKTEHTMQKAEEKKSEQVAQVADKQANVASGKSYSCSLGDGEIKHVVCVDFDATTTREDAVELCGEIQSQYKQEGDNRKFSVNETPCPTENRVGSCNMHDGHMILRSYAPVSVEEARADCLPDAEYPELVPVFTEN